MRILMLRPQIEVGGVTTHIRLLARELTSRGHKVELVTSRQSSAAGLDGIDVPVSFAPLFPSTPAHLARSVYRLSQVVRTRSVDLLHSHHRFTTMVGHAVSRLTGVPLVVTVHEFKQDRRWLARTWTGSITIIPSHALAAHLRDFYGVDEASLRVIPNAVDPTPAIDIERQNRLREALNGCRDVPLVGFVGRLSPEKGCNFFISSIPIIRRRFPHTRFIVVGTGPDEAELRRQAQSLDLELDSIFMGERSEIAELMALMDIVVVPSVSESFALVALEAMRAARPVVASSVGGIPEVVRNGETGLLVPPRSPTALSVAICRLLAQPRERHRLGTRGRALVLEHFAPSKMAECTIEAYYDAATLKNKR